MKKTVRFLPLIATAILLATVTLLQSCAKKDDKPQSAEQKVDSLMKQADQKAEASKPADQSSGSLTLDDRAKKGQAIFYNNSFGKVKASCAMCHSDGTDKTKDGHTRSGHSLVGVTNHTTTWNGMYKGDDLQKNAFGARLCVSAFQHRGDWDMTKALSNDEIESLNAYLTAISSSTPASKNLTIQWVAKPTFKDDEQPDAKLVKPAVKAIMKLAGDPGKGQAVFQAACASCHDIKQKKVGPSMIDASGDMNYVAQSIRTGSSAMPFFAKDILSDQQIADVIAYIQSSVSN